MLVVGFAQESSNPRFSHPVVRDMYPWYLHAWSDSSNQIAVPTIDTFRKSSRSLGRDSPNRVMAGLETKGFMTIAPSASCLFR